MRGRTSSRCSYEDIAAAHAFLVKAFGFEAGILERDRDGRVVHGEVSMNGSAIWMHRATAEHGLTSPKGLAAVSSGVVVLVDDVDDHFRRARAAGAVIEHEPADQPYGQREDSARDPEGGRWYFATRTAPVCRARERPRRSTRDCEHLAKMIGGEEAMPES